MYFLLSSYWMWWLSLVRTLCSIEIVLQFWFPSSNLQRLNDLLSPRCLLCSTEECTENTTQRYTLNMFITFKYCLSALFELASKSEMENWYFQSLTFFARYLPCLYSVTNYSKNHFSQLWIEDSRSSSLNKLCLPLNMWNLSNVSKSLHANLLSPATSLGHSNT